jgi:dTDP-4-amino-4,6-dideoxygalactose transaminase
VRTDFLPFSPPSIGEEEIAEVVATLHTPWITTGPKTRRFEEQFAEFIGTEGALAVSSCTDAMLIALAALGIGEGDAVFVPTMTFCATANVVEHLKATPVLVDCDATTMNIDPTLLARAVEQTLAEGRLRPRAVMPVHFAGRPCDMVPIVELARRHDLAVVEDAAHALPARHDGRTVGAPLEGVTWATAFSFYATKNLATAEGGMLTGSPDLLEEAALWRLHGMSRDAWNRYGKGGSWYYEVVRPGFKCNMTDITAAIGLHQLERLEGFQRRREAVVAAYQEGLSGLAQVELPPPAGDDTHAWHLYVMKLHLERLRIDRAAFIDEMTDRNIGTSVHFIPVHAHPWYQERLGHTETSFPVAWQEYQRTVSLPLHPGLSDADVADVIEAVTAVAQTHAR